MQKEIGSSYWLNPNENYLKSSLGSPGQFGCSGEDYAWLSTGRSAIALVIRTIESRCPSIKKTAVLPSFTCDTVIRPFLDAGYDVYYYPVDENLASNSSLVLNTVIEYDASIVLFHRYYGFDTFDRQIDDLCESLRRMGKFTIEDCTQCLYSQIPRMSSDFAVGSIRKWTGTPDGGFAVSQTGGFVGKPKNSDKRLETAKLEASFAKYRYLFENVGEKEDMLELFRQAEDILDNQKELYGISEMSAKVQCNLDIVGLKRKRRENYSFLFNSICLKVKPVFSLSGYEVPLYFPIYVEDRDSLQKFLIRNDIFAPIVWPRNNIQTVVCNGAEIAYKHLLCLPIDQRYDVEDMNRIVEVINKYYK